MANFSKFTRYRKFEIEKNRNNQLFLILRKPIDLEPADGDIYVTVTEDIIKRPDLISYKAYGMPDLWWIIYEFNKIQDPLFELQRGQILRIPELSRVQASLKKLGF